MSDMEQKSTRRIEEDAELLYAGLCQVLEYLRMEPAKPLDINVDVERNRTPRRHNK